MKKIPIITLLAAVSCGSAVHAGAMGNADSVPCLSSFFLLEGGVSGNQLKGYEYTLTGLDSRLKSQEKNTNYAGRLSAGLQRAVTEEFAVTSEIGYGIYGRTKHTPNRSDFATLNVEHTMNGFDALAGVAYTDLDWSLFFKAGALVETRTTKTTSDLTFLLPLEARYQETVHHTSVLPEIKIGGIYNFDQNWGVSLSYMHAFGSNTKTTGDINTNTHTITFTNDQQNPSINAVMLGIQVTV